ncbi:RNA-directed DNA polymerase [Sulfidibacter corallicola]|uniref:RNA-directed DNA polymerase n=1 Tax=Sulfidibacter corallicola TaxID=2818388 RepID=A0A8A4TPS2_SULCO|nr:RNA-directed DNA polymerase [Sulfidibacter corallicola]QTD50911.1 RNA-directed DNA polymerase [Sulfidibacter corallicola]
MAFPCLYQAWRDVRRGKRRRPDVAAFELEQDRYLVRLADQLQDDHYRHGPYRLMTIQDPKPRLIARASVRDRVVHMACYRALGPFFNRKLIDDTYACLPGRGSHRAVLRFREFQTRYPWLLHLDLRGYYARIDHAILLDLLLPFLRDDRWAPFLREILASGAAFYRQPRVQQFFGLEGSHLSKEVPWGLPIGNLTSQWWGNFYLNGLDHFIKRDLGCQGYLRYMDDFVLFAEARSTLADWRNELRQWLWRERGLQFHEERAHVRPSHQRHTFLGYRVHPSGIDLGKKAVRRFRKRGRRLRSMSQAQQNRSLVSTAGAWLF